MKKKSFLWESMWPEVWNRKLIWVLAALAVFALPVAIAQKAVTGPGGTGRKVHKRNVVTQNRGKLDFNKCDGGISGSKCWVDLGLPSGILWATSNMDTDSPVEGGSPYAWGEVWPKSRLYTDPDKLMYTEGNWRPMLDSGDYSKRNLVPSLDICGSREWDAATNRMSWPWRMPTVDDFRELFAECTVKFIDNPGGFLVTGKNGHYIFLPLSPSAIGGSLSVGTGHTVYWTGQARKEGSRVEGCAVRLDKMNSPMFDLDFTMTKWCGFAIRPVADYGKSGMKPPNKEVKW